jgi:hypothetical protein
MWKGTVLLEVVEALRLGKSETDILLWCVNELLQTMPSVRKRNIQVLCAKNELRRLGF